MSDSQLTLAPVSSFFDRSQVSIKTVPVGPGIPIGMEQVYNPSLGIGGVYGTWGECYSNVDLQQLLERRLGRSIPAEELLSLGTLGFLYRHHIPELTEEEDLALEVEVGARFLQAAAQACGWETSEVEAVLVGSSGPVSNDYLERIATQAGIPEHALKVSVHKACDGSVGSLQLALNPNLETMMNLPRNLAKNLVGKKVLVGGIEGLSRFIKRSRDLNALQLFANGAGVIGVIPGQTMKFLVGKIHDVFDVEGVLKARMTYPHASKGHPEKGVLEVSQVSPDHLRVAGLLHEPDQPGESVEMAGPMGMVKLFVRTGVEVVRDVYAAYQEHMAALGRPTKDITVGIVHHANLKINQLKEKHLQREGINISMPWLVSDFGNVSAASNMIAFLRQLPQLLPGDHILFDGFGAGTYYDVLAVELGGKA